jgi:Rps23 Pro-64 3,4-dihydroxylase Tpa1-like proline 4-hydroxylase
MSLTSQFHDAVDNYLMINGQRLPLDELITVDITSQRLINEQRAAFKSNKPFEHLVVDGLFNEKLLWLIEEEFPEQPARYLNNVSGPYESTYRSKTAADFGPATQTYFYLINSHRFVRYISAITGIPDLITDHTLLGGGLHETRAGGWFAIHRDFNLHNKTMLANTLVFLTYLNRGWKPEYNGALELWDAEGNKKVTHVEPIFGRSILFRHSEHSFHGHPTPLTPPPGRTRRSLGAYYYVNDLAGLRKQDWKSSTFLAEQRNRKLSPLMQARSKFAELRTMSALGALKYVARGVMPPAVWWAAKALRDAIRQPSA